MNNRPERLTKEVLIAVDSRECAQADSSLEPILSLLSPNLLSSSLSSLSVLFPSFLSFYIPRPSFVGRRRFPPLIK